MISNIPFTICDDMKKLTKLFILLLIGCVSSVGVSVASTEIVEGKDYTVLSTPQATDDARSIEVIEFFWYGCPHCYDLHPHIDQSSKNARQDVKFRCVPAIFRANWTVAAKTFYAMEALGILKDLHDKVYDAIHAKKIDLAKESTLFEWVEKQGVDRKEFVNAYNSFSVQNMVNRASQMTKQYKLTGVPALVVEGKYLTSGKMTGLPRDTILVLDALIEKARKEKSSQ